MSRVKIKICLVFFSFKNDIKRRVRQQWLIGKLTPALIKASTIMLMCTFKQKNLHATTKL